MKINPVSGATPITGGYPVKKVTGPKPTSPSGKMDEVSFSEEAMSLHKLVASVKEETRLPADQARKDELAARINKGDYQVDAKEVAAKMMRDILS